MSAISVVVAVYNSQPWLRRFAASLQRQTFHDFEVLLVDDASTDESAAVAAAIASADPRFKTLRLPENRGCGVARNLGIRRAAGETICFADPDDLLPENSLEARYAAYKTHKAIVRACHDEVLDDGTIRNHETRPEGFPEMCKPAEVGLRLGVDPFLCAHWTWLMPTALLRRHEIFHGENMRTADDIVMLARLFFHINRLVWIPDTVYYWMKRSDSLSTTLYTPEHYANYFTCCDIFYEEAEKRGRIALADEFFNGYLATYQRHLLGQIACEKSDEDDALLVLRDMAGVAERHKVFERRLSDMQKNPMRYPGFFRLWHILRSESPSAVQRLAKAQNAAAGLSRDARYEELRRTGWSRQVAFDAFDAKKGLVRARYHFFKAPPEERFFWDEAAMEPAYAKNRKERGGNDAGIFERILWLPLPPEGEKRLRLLVGDGEAGLNHTADEVRAAFAPKPLDDASFPREIRALRRLARSGPMREKCKNAWLFIDRDTEADDNAEHLYRWVWRNHPEINAWFVLNRDSHDWPRLAAEGFKLVAHASMEHQALFLNAANLVSSSMDRYIFAPLEERYCSDFPKPTFTCLQHGVTKDDLSNWFNTIPFDVLVAVTRDELASFVADGTAYVVTEKETRLTGFPRHDAWLDPVKMENILFVMPTWRADLVGKWDGKGQRRDDNPDFFASDYVKTWKDVFEDPRMGELLEKYGFRVVFFSHPGFENYLAGMPFPGYVEKRSKAKGSLLELMKRSKAIVTDYSSVAFDMAYAHRPVVYYQFEKRAAYAGSQNWNRGYFNYETMGFGPVCQDRDALFAALDEALRADGVMPSPYAERVDATFPFRDKNCRKRVFDAIQEAARPFTRKTD